MKLHKLCSCCGTSLTTKNVECPIRHNGLDIIPMLQVKCKKCKSSIQIVDRIKLSTAIESFEKGGAA
jgi:hypothetical protein